MEDTSKTLGYKPRPIHFKAFSHSCTVKPNNFDKNVIFSKKMCNRYLGFSLLSIFIAICLKWSHKSSFNQNKPRQFTLSLFVLINQANISKHKFDQTWRIVYRFLDIFHMFYTFPHCQRLTNVRFKSDGQEKSTKILILWQELKNQFLSFFVHR